MHPQIGGQAKAYHTHCESMACKAGTFEPSTSPVQSQVNHEGEGDSRMFNFVRESPHEQGVDCIRRIDSKGHLCGKTCALAACALLIMIIVCKMLPIHKSGQWLFLVSNAFTSAVTIAQLPIALLMDRCACVLCRPHIQVCQRPGSGQHAGGNKACLLREDVRAIPGP